MTFKDLQKKILEMDLRRQIKEQTRMTEHDKRMRIWHDYVEWLFVQFEKIGLTEEDYYEVVEYTRGLPDWQREHYRLYPKEDPRLISNSQRYQNKKAQIEKHGSVFSLILSNYDPKLEACSKENGCIPSCEFYPAQGKLSLFNKVSYD